MPDVLDFSKFGATPSVEPEPSNTIDFSRFGATPSTVDQVHQAPPAEFDGTGGEFGRGVARGLLVAGSGFVNFIDLFADSPKLKATADSLLQDASMIPTKAGSIKDVLADPTLAPAYVSRVVGELAPQAVMAYLTGGTGAAVGRAAGLGAAGVRVATGVGAATSSVPQEVGHIYHETGSKGAALAYGIPAGALDALSAERIMGKVFRAGTEEAKRKTWRQIVRDTVNEIPRSIRTESVTETIQESLAILANKSADETYELLTPDNGWRILEAAVAGAIGGGVLGGGVGLASIPAQKAARGQRAQYLRLTRQVRDNIRTLQREQEAAQPVSKQPWQMTMEEADDAGLSFPEWQRSVASHQQGVLGGVLIINIDEIIQNGGGRVRVSTPDGEIDFEKFGVVIDGNEATVPYVELRDKSQAGKGIGKRAYIALGESLSARGITLKSSGALLPQGQKLWASLVRSGHAIREGGGYSFNVAPVVEQAPETGSVRTPAPIRTDADLTAQSTDGVVSPVAQFVAQNRPIRPPAVPAQAPASTLPGLDTVNLVPVLETTDGRIYPGMSHPQAMAEKQQALARGEIAAEEFSSIMEAQDSDPQHKFLNVDTGQVLNRTQAGLAIGFNGELQSEHLPQAYKERNLPKASLVSVMTPAERNDYFERRPAKPAPEPTLALPEQSQQDRLNYLFSTPNWASPSLSAAISTVRGQYPSKIPDHAGGPSADITQDWNKITPSQRQQIIDRGFTVTSSRVPGQVLLKAAQRGTEEATRLRVTSRRLMSSESVPSEEFNWITGISATGKSGIVELLSNDKIQLDPEIRRIGLGLLSKINPKYLDRLTFSVDANGVAGGEFIPWMNMARVAMNSTDPSVAAHEISHYLANFLTSQERGEVAAIRDSQIAIARTDKANAEFFAWLDAKGGSATSAEYSKWRNDPEIRPGAMAVRDLSTREAAVRKWKEIRGKIDSATSARINASIPGMLPEEMGFDILDHAGNVIGTQVLGEKRFGQDPQKSALDQWTSDLESELNNFIEYYDGQYKGGLLSSEAANGGTPFRFATSTEIALRTPRPFGLTPDKNGFIAKNSLLAKMKNQVSKEELDALKHILDSLTDRVSAALLANRIQEQGPQLEVVKKNAQPMPGSEHDEYAKDQADWARINHDLETAGISVGDYNYYPDPDNYNEFTNKITRLQLRAGGQNLTFSNRALIGASISPLVSKNEKLLNELWDWLEKPRIEKPITGPNDSATFDYQFVNPKPLKDMPGAVDILVRIPLNVLGGKDQPWHLQGTTEPAKFRGHHFGNSDVNVVGWVRGYIETLPNGERVFHVFEVQSDWAQKIQKLKEQMLPGEPESKFPELRELGDPLLAYYESAALKAAIRHARELGITKVAISDAETSMLTEGHDRVAAAVSPVSVADLTSKMSANTLSEAFGEDWEHGRYLRISGNNNASGTYRVDKPDSNNPNYVHPGIAKELAENYNPGYIYGKPPQEPGMRLHYDQTLPNIMRKLTGSAPVMVDFGVHQNAVEYADSDRQKTDLVPRKDLLFGGKTSITARVFDTSSIDVEIPAQMYRSSLYSVADPLYHLINDDEFFAHYMSEAARRAVPAELRTIIEKVRDIILRILEAIKEFAGANPDYWQELMRKFERGHFLVHENGGMLYERNNRSTARSLPPIKGLPALRQYTGVDQGQDEAALIRTLTYEQNQPLVAHAADLFRLLPRDVRAELPGVASRLAALVETQRQGGAVGQTPLRHYAVLVNALALQEEGRTLSGEIEKIVEDIQKQGRSKDKAGMAEVLAKQLEAIARQSISDYKNFQITEKNKGRNEGISEAINREIKFLDSLRDSTDPLRRAIEIISESVTLEQLNDPNASTQSIVDIAKKRIVELTGAATWQQATIPAGSGKVGVPNDQLRIAVAVLQENQRLVQDLITYKELSDPAFAKIMREGEAGFDKHIASLTYGELRSFLKTYHSVRSAKDRARQIYLKHRARMKGLIERLEVKVAADDFFQAQVIGSVQFKTALRDAAQFDFMSADLFKDGNGNHVLRRTYYNPLNKEESIDIVDGTTKESYEKNADAYEQVATWFEDAIQDENIDELDRKRASFELGRIYYEEMVKEYDEQGKRMVYKPRREYSPESGKRTAGPFNISNILANLTGNSLQYAMQKIGGRASVQLGSIAKTRSEAIRRTSEVRHDMTVPLQTSVIDAAKDHGMELSRWQEEIAEPILSSYNSIGSKQIKAGDTTRFGHKVTGKDMVAIRNMKAMTDAMSRAGIEIDTISAKNHPIRIKETIFGREITRLQQGGTELIVPRRFRKRFIKMLEAWHEIKRNKTQDQYLKYLVQHVQSGPVFDNLIVAHIYSTQRYPDYANVTRFKQAYREIYNQILDNRPPSSFSEVVEIVFQNQTGLDPALQLTREDIAKEIITKEIDAMARKVVDQDVKNRAGDTPGTQVRIDSADNFLTKPRGQMIAPDVGYQYSIINKEDIKWLSRSVIEVHEQMARDGLMKIKKMLEDYVVEWKDRAKHPEAQRESIKKQISGEDWMNYREARQMLNQINRLIDKTSPEAFNSFIDEQFGGIGRRVWSILIQSLLQSATVLKNNLFGMNLALWQMEVQWRGDGVWMGMPKWLLKLPTMAKNGIAWPMRDTVAFVVGGHAYRRTIKKGVSIDVKGTKFYGEDALRIAAANPNLAKAVTAQVGGFLLKRAINIQRARDLGAAGPYGLKDQVSRYLTMHLRGGEIENLDQTTAENIKGSVASLLGLFQETGVFVAFPVMLPKAAAPRKLEHLLNFQAQRHADRLLEELTLDLKEALLDRKENGISSQPVTDAELLGDSTAKQGEALYLRRMFSRAGINLEVAIQRLTTRESSFDLLTPPEWNSFVLEVQKEMNMPSADNRVIFRSGFGRLMSSLMGYGFWYNERAADAMARDSRKQFDLAALYRGMFFFGVIVAMGVLVGTPIQRWLKRFFYNEEDQTGHFSSDNTAWRNIGVLWEQTAPFWPIIGSVMSQLYDARTGGGKLFNFLPVSVATQALQSANEIGQTGNVFYPTVKLLRQWLPNTKIVLNRIPETEGLMEVNSAGRILRSTAAGDVEVRTQKTGGAIKYSPVSTETQMAVNEMARSDPDYEAIKHYRDEAVRKLVRRGASRQDAERRFDLSVLARYPENTVFGRPLTPEERSRQQSRMGADQIARLSQVEDSFDRYANTFGLRAPSRLRQSRTRAGSSDGLSSTRVGIGRRRRRTRLVRNRSLTRRRNGRLVRF